MLIDFNLPKKVMSEKDRIEKYSSDFHVPGTYVPNMSVSDMKKWKGKYVKGKDERVEIRKTINGVQLVVIIYKEERSEIVEGYSHSYENLIHKNIHISANGKILLSFDEYNELLKVIEEAKSVIKSGSIYRDSRSKELDIDYIYNLPNEIKRAINRLEINTNVFVNKIFTSNGYYYCISNELGHIWSNNHRVFHVELLLTDNCEKYLKEIGYPTIEEAIEEYNRSKI